MSEAGDVGREDRPPGPVLKDLSGILIILAASVVLFLLTGQIEQVPIPGQLGPAFWPRMILILLMVSCGIRGAEVMVDRRKGKAIRFGCEGEVRGVKLAAMIVILFVSVFLMDVVGFALANILFLLLFLRLAGVRKPLQLVAISVLGTVGLLYLFVKVVYLPLPKGQWLFDDVTILLYRVLRII